MWDPYLGGVERCDDPHTVRIVVVLNGEVGGRDDARGASEVGITHAGCGEEIRQTVQYRSGSVLPISHPQLRRDANWTFSSQKPPVSCIYAHFPQAQREVTVP